MRRAFCVSVFFLIAALGCGTDATPRGATVPVNLTVQFGDGSPAAFVGVALTPYTAAQTPTGGNTDEAGALKVNVIPGKYSLTFSKISAPAKGKDVKQLQKTYNDNFAKIPEKYVGTGVPGLEIEVPLTGGDITAKMEAK